MTIEKLCGTLRVNKGSEEVKALISSEVIAKRLVDLRGDRTQATVATAIGTSVSAVAMYESGSRMPRDEIKVAIARYFGKTVEEIFYSASTL